MAIQVKAKGDHPATGMPRPIAPDEVSHIRAPGAAGYGMNGPQASSVDPAKAVLSPLAHNLKASVDDDGCLDRIIKEGTARQDDTVTGQLRKIASGNVPNHPAMSGASKGGTVPGKIGG